MNKKILYSIIISTVVISLGLYTIMDLYLYIYDPQWRGILHGEVLEENPRIFLLGSSSVYPVNATFVMEFLKKDQLNYEVYNLADMSDTPSHRLKSIDHLISLKPDVVGYGIGLLDFNQKSLSKNSFDSKDYTEKTNPKILLGTLFSEVTGEDILQKLPTSPKDRTILSIKYIVRGPEYIHHPFINFHKTGIANTSELESYNDKINFKGIEEINSNQELIALKEIIKKLKENNIRVLLFTVPYHESFLNNVSLEDKNKFEEILNQIQNTYEVKIEFLQNKYSNMSIWRDVTHVAVNQKSIIFSEDIAEYIHKELIDNVI